MTIEEFARAIVTFRRKYHGRVRSWGRTNADSIDVGGFADDPHNWDLGVDITYPGGPNHPDSDATHPKLPYSCPMCSEFGLKVIHETSHDHLQPSDFPAGPAKQYAGIVKDWA